jgi:hypothetical protein
MTKPIVPLRPEDLSPQMLMNNVIQSEEFKRSKKCVVLLMDDEERVEIWTTDMKDSEIALLSLKLTELANLYLDESVEFVD